MLIQGDYVKIKNKEGYEGKYGIIKGFDGYYYSVRLLYIKKTILCLEDEIEKVSKEKVEKNQIKIKFNDGSHLVLKDQDMRTTCECLKTNRYFKGLYALGKYYSSKSFPEEFKSDYLTQQILNIKNKNQSSAKEISKIFLYFIENSKILTKIINKVDFILMMPTIRDINHVKYWGDILCAQLKKPDLSEFIYIPSEKKEALNYYKYKKAWERVNVIEGAFEIRNAQNNLPSLNGKTCLILDDICTTGNQINEFTNTIAKERVKEVYAFVIGKTKS